MKAREYPDGVSERGRERLVGEDLLVVKDSLAVECPGGLCMREFLLAF
jgi:hypothetical protein